MLSSLDVRFVRYASRAGLLPKQRQSRAAVAAIALVGVSALIFDAVTPATITVGIFYVGMILLGFWFPQPKVAFALALLATFLMTLGYLITIPDATPTWELLLNRFLDIGTVWMAAVFVWYIRVLEQKLKA